MPGGFNELMAIPTFEDVMLPLLILVRDGKEHRLVTSTEALADQFGLTEQERSELLPSGKQAAFRQQSRLGKDLSDQGWAAPKY
jgi:restriction endonuclease Mrr